MKKKVFGRQFKRDANERKALFKGLMTELVMRESIQTTLPKAKSIKGQVEKLVTKAKVKKEAARPLLQPYVSSEAVEKILTNLAVRFADRPGGYTRIVKLGSRFSDNADMAVIEWVEKAEMVTEKVEEKKASARKIKTEKVSPKVTSSKETVEAKIAAPKAKKTAAKTEKKVSTKAKKESK